MSAEAALRTGPPPAAVVDVRALSPARLVGLARSYGPLRAVEPHQAAVVRAAAVYDRSVLPRWQRAGDGVHHWCSPADYGTGRTWVRRSLGPVPGATGRAVHGRVEVQARRPHLQWRTREHWTDVVVPAAVRQRPEALATTRGRVQAATFLLWARTIAHHAHDRTGRRCVVRVDRLAELMEVSKSTVQRCQLAAEGLGLYVVLVPGRMLTEQETYQARRQGSRQRGLANDAALVVPAWIDAADVDGVPSPRPPRLTDEPAHVSPRRSRATGRRLSLVEAVDNPGPEELDAPASSVELPGCDTPTRGRYRNPSTSPSTCSLGPQQRSAGETEPPPAARHLQDRLDGPGDRQHRPPGVAPERGVGPPERPQGRSYDPNALQLARNLAEQLPWLRSTAAGRLEPMLRRFTSCSAPWRAEDLVAAIDASNRRLGRASMTADRVKHPPALLAHYLRELDVDADHPNPDYTPGQTGVHGFAAGERVSAQTYRNRLLLEAHREARAGAGSTQTPDVALRATALIRDDLRRRREDRDSRRRESDQPRTTR